MDCNQFPASSAPGEPIISDRTYARSHDDTVVTETPLLRSRVSSPRRSAKHPRMNSDSGPATPDPVVADTQVVPEQPATVAQPLSKKAQKRAAKAAYLAEQKKERRAAEKERKKEKKRILAEKRAAGELDEEEEARLKKKRRTGDGPKRPFTARVVVDLGFDDMMTENVSARLPEHTYGVCKSDRYTGSEVPHVAARLHL